MVHWRHGLDSEPVWLYSEVGGDGLEVRKVDEYRDGSLDLAGHGIETGTTMLATTPTPSLSEINADREFCAREISREEFENVWARACEWFDIED